MKINKLSEWGNLIQTKVQSISNNCRGSFDRYHSESSMICFFDRGQENPSVAKIIAYNEISKRGPLARMRFFNKYYSNKFSWQRQEFEDSFNKLYPKTGSIRTQLINNGKIALDRVKPKASKLEKFLIFSKL